MFTSWSVSFLRRLTTFTAFTATTFKARPGEKLFWEHVKMTSVQGRPLGHEGQDRTNVQAWSFLEEWNRFLPNCSEYSMLQVGSRPRIIKHY